MEAAAEGRGVLGDFARMERNAHDPHGHQRDPDDLRESEQDGAVHGLTLGRNLALDKADPAAVRWLPWAAPRRARGVLARAPPRGPALDSDGLPRRRLRRCAPAFARGGWRQ